MPLLLMLLALSQAAPSLSFPTIYVARYAKECTDHPSADFGKVHEYSQTPDRWVLGQATHVTGGVSFELLLATHVSSNMLLPVGCCRDAVFFLTSQATGKAAAGTVCAGDGYHLEVGVHDVWVTACAAAQAMASS